MITETVVAGKILAFMNGQLTETELIHWAEDAFVALSETDSDVANEGALLDVLGYLGAGDTAGFPLTWSALSDFLDRLGVKIRVIAE